MAHVKHLFLFLTLYLVCSMNSVIAQDDIIHYYVQINGKKTDKFKFEFGHIVYNDKQKPMKIALENISDYASLTKTVYKHVNQNDTHDQLNVFIHGIWAHIYFEWKDMIDNIGDNIYTTNDKKTVLLSVIWDSSANYFTGVRIARRKGDHASSLLNELLEQKGDNRLSFLCHSMGNRIFEHAVKNSKYYNDNSLMIDHYVSVGADLEANIFDKGEPLEYLPNLIKEVSIYKHNNDRSLIMSKLVNNNRRLGLHGINKLEEKPANMKSIDVSTIKYFEDFSSNFSNHRYFYKSEWIMKDLKSVIWNQDLNSNKIELASAISR